MFMQMVYEMLPASRQRQNQELCGLLFVEDDFARYLVMASYSFISTLTWDDWTQNCVQNEEDQSRLPAIAGTLICGERLRRLRLGVPIVIGPRYILNEGSHA